MRSSLFIFALTCALASAFISIDTCPKHNVKCVNHSWRQSTRVSSLNDVDSWMQAMQDASGKNKGGLIGLDEIKERKKLQGIAGPVVENDKRLEENSALLNWLADNGVWVYDRSDWGQAPHSLAVAIDTVDESENERAGRGMVANKEIKEGDELFNIPMNLILTKEAACREFGAEIITDDLNEYIAIALLLIHERNKGAGSFWKSYIDVLPTIEEVSPTWSWSEEEISYLEGSPVIRTTNSMALKLRTEYNSIYSSILNKHPNIFPSTCHTFEAFQWAFSVLFSRAIRLASLSTGETVALVPYADLFNHNPFANAYVDARQIGWMSKKDEIVVYSDRSYKRMEQVYISYGPKSNSDLLLLYGFALDRNPFNSVDITVALNEEDSLFDVKKQFLENANRPATMSFPLYNDRYPDEALQYLRLICLEPSDNVKNLELQDMEFAEKVSNSNELRVLNLIREACERALEEYPTTEEQDTAVMMDRGMYSLLSKNQRMAVKHRRQEKRILKKTIGAVSAEITRLNQ